MDCGMVADPEARAPAMSVLGLTLALIAVAYLDRVCIAAAAPSIRAEFGLDAEQMGFVFSAFTFSYTLGSRYRAAILPTDSAPAPR